MGKAEVDALRANFDTEVQSAARCLPAAPPNGWQPRTGPPARPSFIRTDVFTLFELPSLAAAVFVLTNSSCDVVFKGRPGNM